MYTTLSTPNEIRALYPLDETSAEVTARSRREISAILHGTSPRLLVVVGPCSIHDTTAAWEYAARIRAIRAELDDDLEIVMRTYFEKPRTTVGWKGFLNDPNLNETYDIEQGIREARRLLLQITHDHGVPCATEFLGTFAPQYYEDLIAWAAIGARTTESQVHREMVSSLSCPVGFKNGTDGNIKNAVDAVISVAHSHHYITTDMNGRTSHIQTDGNQESHIILRGGKTPNYFGGDVSTTREFMTGFKLRPNIMIDVSHGNSRKNHKNQVPVSEYVSEMIASGRNEIIGVMIESFLEEGAEPFKVGGKYMYGRSITDACLSWTDTAYVLRTLAAAVRARKESV